MYSTCPKCGYQLAQAGAASAESCPGCGIVFAKWLRQKLGAAKETVENGAPGATPAWEITRRLGACFLHVDQKTNPFIFWGRVAVFAGIVAWGWRFMSMDFAANPFEIGRSFMHNVNLVFHEAGHVIFRPLGWFMTILGGTLGQLLMPAALVVAFVFKFRNTFAASICLWWLGQSFMDTAPYIDDALDQNLVLLGGHTGADAPGNHDWNNILGEFNALERHREFASYADTTGTVLMLLAFAWGGLLLYRQYRRLN